MQNIILRDVLNADGLKPKKVEAIDRIKLTTMQKQIKSFLGMTSYLGRYIKDYFKIGNI